MNLAALTGMLRRRDERGLVLTTPQTLLSAAAVGLAAVALVTTAPADELAPVAAPPLPTAPAVTLTPEKVDPVVRRSDAYVSVFNNSSITGLAGRTADQLSGAGWNVVGSDNWYGTIPATTVYYPEQFEEQAQLLAKDLGVTRVKPAIDPMSMDRLTVILTADFA